MFKRKSERHWLLYKRVYNEGKISDEKYQTSVRQLR